jgi:arylsulfatase A-like enzyme
MKLPERIPPNQPWTDLIREQKSYASRILAVRAAMIENMDHDVGKVIQLLKAKGQYDNTLIVFSSDNGTSEPNGLLNIHFSSADAQAVEAYLKMVNNTLSNLGNVSSTINYAAWVSYSGIGPLSGFKVSEYEGGTRVPFIVRARNIVVVFLTKHQLFGNSSIGVSDYRPNGTPPQIVSNLSWLLCQLLSQSLFLNLMTT